jgi:hypothetical protein
LALHAFIDESGQRARTRKSSDHFVMAAVVYRDFNEHHVTRLLARMRADMGRMPGHRLHWQNFKTHHHRLRAAQLVGGASFLKVTSVVVCKRLLPPAIPDDDSAYLYTFRFLLERLSWLAEEQMEPLSYTLSHVRRFPISKLREYENKLRGRQTEIHWHFLDPRGGRLANDQKIEQLQLADTAASAIAEAFEPDAFGNTEQRYLRELVPRLYRGPGGSRPLTSYGLKMHPWNDAARAAYPWVTGL